MRNPHMLRPLVYFLFVTVAVTAHAQDGPLNRRAQQLADAVCGGLADPTAYFDAAFLNQVPPATIALILEQYCDEAGKVTAVVTVDSQGPTFAELEFHTERGRLYPVRLGIADAAPHLVHTLWFGPSREDLGEWEEVQAALEDLPGTVAFTARELGTPDREPQMHAERLADRALAIGSVFKLYVLGALVAKIEAGQAAWDDIVELQSEQRSLPSGRLHSWPAGAPVTLHTLAMQMISISDNTATDHLIHYLGRDRVEAALPVMGMTAPAANLPFPTTREMFLLKAERGTTSQLERWRTADEATRRIIVDEMADLDLAAANVVFDRPLAIADAEWFATANDLGRALEYLHAAAGGDPAQPPLSVLAANPGLPDLRKHWSYVGFKGGSEPGVLSFAWLLRDDRGRWFILTFAWNDAEAEIDEPALLSVVKAAAGLLSRLP